MDICQPENVIFILLRSFVYWKVFYIYMYNVILKSIHTKIDCLMLYTRMISSVLIYYTGVELSSSPIPIRVVKTTTLG